jgi:hypothetical protein
MFFFEKKNQKTFLTRRTSPGWRLPNVIKVLCFFSSEKKTFLPSSRIGAMTDMHPEPSGPGAAC